MDKGGIKTFSRNFGFTLSANLVSLFFNTALVFLLPKYLDGLNYGYWQLYQMYALYIGYLTFGITDGVYIRYGGELYEQLPKNLFRSQFWFLVIAHIFSDAVIFIIVINFVTDHNKLYVFIMMCIAGLLYVPKTLITFSLQATNRIKEYSIITIFEKLIVLTIVLVVLSQGINLFHAYLIADILGRTITLIYSVYVAKELVLGPFPPFKVALTEIWVNMSVGIKVLIANLSSLMINGVVRLFIERKWGVQVFGQISFSFSVSNIITTLILAVSIVFFPVLKRMEKEEYTLVYSKVRSILTLPLAAMLLGYFPIAIILTAWIPSFEMSIKYLALLFPITLFESNMKLLTNNYLKSLRKESTLMIINIGAVFFTIVLAVITTYLLQNLLLSIGVIVFVYALRSTIAELIVNRLLRVNTGFDIFLDYILAITFILSAWYLNVVLGAAVYFLCLSIYMLVKKEEITMIYRTLRNMK